MAPRANWAQVRVANLARCVSLGQIRIRGVLNSFVMARKSEARRSLLLSAAQTRADSPISFRLFTHLMDSALLFSAPNGSSSALVAAATDAGPACLAACRR